MRVDNEAVLTKIIKAIYRKAEKERLDADIVAEVVGDLQYIFHKNPKKKDKQVLCMQRFELHHLSGKTNSQITLTAHNFPCHAEINCRQMAWDSRWTRSDNSDMLKASFIVNGVYELLLEKHFLTGIRDYRIMADALPSLIRYYRESD